MRRGRHDINEVYWDLFMKGWRMICSCGYGTRTYSSLERTGADMDEHFEEADREYHKAISQSAF